MTDQELAAKARQIADEEHCTVASAVERLRREEAAKPVASSKKSKAADDE